MKIENHEDHCGSTAAGLTMLPLLLCLCLIGGISTARGQGQPYVLDDRTLVQDIDRVHRQISERIINSAEAIDQFFVDDRILDERNESQLRVNTALRYEDGASLSLQPSLSGRLVLPHLKDRFQVFVDTDDIDRDVRDNFSETAETPDERRSLFAGLRYVSRDTNRTRVNLDGGLRWRSGPVPFLRLRLRRTLTYEEWAIRLTQRFFWFEDRGFGEQTAIDFERQLDASHFFRATPSMIWSEESQGVDWRQQFSVFYVHSEDTMYSVILDVQGFTRPSFHVDKYEAIFRWRRRGHRDWLFYEVSPALSFPRKNDYALTPILKVQVEVLFGGSIYWERLGIPRRR